MRQITTRVSCFDFKQQLLSISRDEYHESKESCIKNEPGKDPDFGSDKLKHIHDVEWYRSGYHY